MSPGELDYRFDTAAAPEGRAELARLIRDVFDLDVTPLDRFGHDPSLVSFGWWRGPDLVANVDLVQQTLWLDGDRVEALGVQSVAVRPAWRGRGLFRDLMDRALAHAAARVAVVTLTTETPALYTPFGFREIVESWFGGPLVPGGARPHHRRLSLEDTADVALIRAMFARRTPVSRVAAVTDHPALFFLKALESPEIALVHLAELDAVVAVEDREPDVLTLWDVVAPTIPRLTAIAAALGGRANRARVLVTPDRLGWEPAEIVAEDAGLMVRGAFPPEGRPFMLSAMRI
ncbi:GNAT family N-acetyltransferase [Siculibacillus lacustris]|uniref:GNAT family N-acetyltransferase n=1 Tax=Siculibacillus lacustris TaxID=1549641 RepID=A0A4Q9VMB7_9HYPH|nr:GNAT family N-acetyltransferase [Siculibacillus lacustris]TBW36609.1 GNAT family N-acetyltransferase [Siculibacillus lacustris]